MALDPNFAIYASTPTRVPPLVGRVDAWPTQEHLLTLDTTEYPIESGSILTDNAVRRPEQLRLTGFVADLLPAPDIDPATGPNRAIDAWAAITQIIRDRTPVDVQTPLRLYTDMLLIEAKAPIDVRTGRSLRFELRFTEILFAETALVRLAPETVAEDGPAQDRTSQVDGGDRNAIYAEPPPALDDWVFQEDY